MMAKEGLVNLQRKFPRIEDAKQSVAAMYDERNDAQPIFSISREAERNQPKVDGKVLMGEYGIDPKLAREVVPISQKEFLIDLIKGIRNDIKQ